MGKIDILPGKLRGIVTVPGSKSAAHRAIICAGLARGETLIENVDLCDDIIATLGGISALGAKAEKRGNNIVITGIGGREHRDFIPRIDCKESGSTARFLIPVALAVAGAGRFTGTKGLAKRPFDVYFDIFKSHGIKYTQNLPGFDLKLAGGFKGGNFTLPGNVSSQFITGLLFALPLCRENSEITLTTPLQSVGYVDMTLDMLQKFGITVEQEGYETFRVPGNQVYHARNITVESDWSQAGFWYAAKALGSSVDILGLDPHSTQGDRVVAEHCERFSRPGDVDIDVSGCPDLLPPLAVMAAIRQGTTRFVNAARLRMKESDRLATTAAALNALGGRAEEGPDSLTVHGISAFAGGTVDGANDHRIVMAAAIAATHSAAPVTILGAEAVKKSYPSFWEDYKMLGGVVHVL